MARLTDLLNRYLGEGGIRRHLWLLALGALGIALLLVGQFYPRGKPVAAGGSPAAQEARGVTEDRSRVQREEEYLAARLARMLAEIEGAGRVSVVVKLEGSSRVEYAVNTNTGRRVTEEKDAGAVRRVTTESDANDQLVVVRGEQGLEAPVVEREVSPRVAGVLVVAEGARNPHIKAKLFRAVQVALGVEPQRILVLPKEV